MPEYRRAFIPGGTYFFTVVAHERRPFLTSDLGRSTLRAARRFVQERRPFNTQAFCLLPDHLHCVWTLPSGDAGYPERWQMIKSRFSRTYLAAGGEDGSRNPSRLRRREAALWQRRYWEHAIRDEGDFARHIDYIHYNPVKHGLVTRPADWPWSTFHRFVAEGGYDITWGAAPPAHALLSSSPS